MKRSRELQCPQCRVLTTELAALKEEVAKLREELASAKKNSSTSSKPPSSDIVKPKPPGDDEASESKRKIGGQPGHPKHERDLFPPEEVTKFEVHTLDACPDCGGKVRRNGALHRVVT